MFNPMQMLMQMMRGGGGNPMQMLMQMMGGNNNPQMNRIMEMTQGKNSSELETLCRNLCQQRGLDFDKVFTDFKKQMGQ